MNREDFIKFIPKPKNEDVIIYDISLKDLIDEDVLLEYNKLYPLFLNKKNEYILMKEQIEQYEKTINNIYLYNNSWNDEDYLLALQNEKKTYNTLYNDIKKIETQIATLNKKIQSIDEKIELQSLKEKKDIDNKKNNIDNEINEQKEKLLSIRTSLSIYKQNLELINSKINDNEEDFKFLVAMEEELKLGKHKCKYCGSIVNVNSENSLIYKRLYKNLETNKKELEKLLKEKEKVELNIAYYESEISKLKVSLNNNIEFKKQNFNFYQKKSLEILKLEALRDSLIKDIVEKENWLKTNPVIKSEQYKKLKANIDKYELSLNNLKLLKDNKSQMKNQISDFKKIKEELKCLIDKMNKYKKFIEIYFKIYEQKAAEYCGKDFKFKIFRFDDYKLINIFEVFYKNIEYTQLSKNDKKEADEILIEKFELYI